MRTKFITYSIFISLFASFGNPCDAQNKFGLTGGVGVGKFVVFNRSSQADFNNRPGINYSSGIFYEVKIDSITNFRTELQYRFQKAGYEVKKYGMASGAGGYYTNIDYEFKQLRLNLDYVINLNDFGKENTRNLIFGFAFAYDINLLATGNGWVNTSHMITDTSGNNYYYMSPTPWEKTGNHSQDFKPFSFGVNFGFEFVLPMRSKHEIIIQNKYTLGIFENLFFSGSLNMGFVFGK